MTTDRKRALCVSCGAKLKGAYCHECGEHVLSEKDRSFKNIIGQTIYGFTHLDNKFLGGLRDLIFRPGLLSAEYIEGKRKKHIKPIQLFLIVNVLYFLIPSVHTFYTPLEYQGGLGFGSLIRSTIENKINDRGVNIEEYSKIYDRTTKSLGKLFIITTLPAFALVLLLLYRKLNFYYADHVIFSIHFLSFLILMMLICIPFAISGVVWLFGDGGEISLGDDLLTGILFAVSVVYLTLALRRVYGASVISSVVKSLVVVCALFPIIMAYRLALFFVTIAVT